MSPFNALALSLPLLTTTATEHNYVVLGSCQDADVPDMSCNCDT